MNKKEKLGLDILDQLDGGTLYVQVDGGDKIRAKPICSGGTMHLEFTHNGKEVSCDTGINLSSGNPIGGLAMFGAVFFDSQSLINFTYQINTEDNPLS